MSNVIISSGYTRYTINALIKYNIKDSDFDLDIKFETIDETIFDTIIDERQTKSNSKQSYAEIL